MDPENVQAYQVLSAWLAAGCEVTPRKVKKQPGPLKTECLFPDNYNPTRDNEEDCPALTCNFAPICGVSLLDPSDIEKHIG